MPKRKMAGWGTGEKRPKAEGHQIKFVQTESNLAKSDIIHFRLDTAPGECVRFVPRPFIITYRIKTPNPKFDEAAEEDEATNPRYNYLQAANMPGEETPATGANANTRINEPPVRLNPCLGMASFFKGCEVVIDKNACNFAKLDRFDILYATANNTFMTDDAYEEYYGVKRLLIPNQTHNRVRQGRWKEAATPLDFGGSTPRTASSRVEAFTMAGIFPFDNHSNILNALRKNKPVRGWFAPETRFSFHLSKRDPVDQAVERNPVDTTDAHYFTGDMPGGAKWDDLILEIQDLVLQYESVHIGSVPLSRTNLGTFMVDVPKAYITEMSARQNKVVTKFDVPAGTKLLMFCYPLNHQLYFDKATRKNLSGRVIFPPHLKELRMDLGEEENILFKDGWTNLGKTNNAQDLACRSYYFQLVKDKLYEPSSIEDMFGYGENDPFKYQSWILINIMNTKGSKSTQQLRLHHIFGSSEGDTVARLSPANTNVLLFCLTSVNYSISNDRKFHFSAVP
jgi:hypothetical protein